MEGESINFLDLEPKVLFSRHGGLAEAQGVIVIQWNFQKNSVAQPFLNLSWEIDSIETTRRHTEPCPFPHLSTRRNSCLLVVVITTNLRVLKLPWRKPKFFALRSAIKQEEVAMLLMAPDDTNIMARCLLCFHSRVDVEGHGPLSALSMLSLGTLNTKAPLRVRKPRVWSTFHSWAKWLSVCHHWNILEHIGTIKFLGELCLHCGNSTISWQPRSANIYPTALVTDDPPAAAFCLGQDSLARSQGESSKRKSELTCKIEEVVVQRFKNSFSYLWKKSCDLRQQGTSWLRHFLGKASCGEGWRNSIGHWGKQLRDATST